MVQTSKVELVIGHCRCDFRYVLIKVEFSELCCRLGQKPEAGVVLSQNVVTACILPNEVIISPVLCLLHVLHFPIPCLREEVCLWQQWPQRDASCSSIVP